MNTPLIGFGQVRHSRTRPAANAFAYPTYFLMLPMRSWTSQMSSLPRNKKAAISFYDADHGNGGCDALAWLDGLLRQEGITEATGEVWLHCYPRVLGYTFKPVSFWYCHAMDGNLSAVVVEVNNTFGERHVYLLDGARFGHVQQASKVFHVSPFCEVEGSYSFRFMTNSRFDRTVACVDYHDADGLLLQTSVSGKLEPITRMSLRKAIFSYGAMTFAVIARIHWQAFKLFMKRVPFFSKPTPPAVWVTR